MSKQWKGIGKPCFEIFLRAKVVNVKIVVEPFKKLLRICEYILYLLKR